MGERIRPPVKTAYKGKRRLFRRSKSGLVLAPGGESVLAKQLADAVGVTVRSAGNLAGAKAVSRAYDRAEGETLGGAGKVRQAQEVHRTSVAGQTFSVRLREEPCLPYLDKEGNPALAVRERTVDELFLWCVKNGVTILNREGLDRDETVVKEGERPDGKRHSLPKRDGEARPVHCRETEVLDNKQFKRARRGLPYTKRHLPCDVWFAVTGPEDAIFRLRQQDFVAGFVHGNQGNPSLQGSGTGEKKRRAPTADNKSGFNRRAAAESALVRAAAQRAELPEHGLHAPPLARQSDARMPLSGAVNVRTEWVSVPVLDEFGFPTGDSKNVQREVRLEGRQLRSDRDKPPPPRRQVAHKPRVDQRLPEALEAQLQNLSWLKRQERSGRFTLWNVLAQVVCEAVDEIIEALR